MSEPRPGSDPTQESGGYPPNTDPAYSGQYWSPGYYGQGAPVTQPPTQPTEQMPPYWQPGMGYPPGPPPPPPPPKSTRWLWIAAGAAVLLVTALVAVLVIVSMSSQDSTIVAPPTAQNDSPIPPRLTLRTDDAAAAHGDGPAGPGSHRPHQRSHGPHRPPGDRGLQRHRRGPRDQHHLRRHRRCAADRVQRDAAVEQGGRRWPRRPKDSASVASSTSGRDVTCCVTVNGVQVRQRTGRGPDDLHRHRLGAATRGHPHRSIPTRPAASTSAESGHARPVGVEDVDEHEEQPRREERRRPAGRRVETERHAFLALGRSSAAAACAPPTGSARRTGTAAARRPRTRAAPDNAIRVSPTTIIAASEPTITGLEPTRSSSRPAEHRADRGHRRWRTTPKSSTSAGDIP